MHRHDLCGALPTLTLRFASERDGGSLAALLRHTERARSCIFLIKERQNGSSAQRLFGAFIPAPLARSARGFLGDRRAFLFGLRPLTIYPATGHDENYVHISSAHGIGFGGDLGGGGFSMHITSNLLHGRCLPSRTYGDVSALTSSRDFEVASVQVWDAAPGERRPSRHAWAGANEHAKSVLQPGENKLMLEFVGIEKDIAMLRRYSG